MANNNIKRRHNKRLLLSGRGLYKPFNPHYHSIGSSLKTNWDASSTGDIAAAALQGASALAGGTMLWNKTAQIENADGEFTDAVNLSRTNFDSSDTNSLLSAYNNADWSMKDDYNFKDFTQSGGEQAGNILKGVGSAALQGASAGSVAGPWGAAIGAAAAGVTALGSGIAGIFVGKKRAKRQADKLNTAVLAAKERAKNSFLSSADRLSDMNFQNRMANIAAYGGNIYDDGGWKLNVPDLSTPLYGVMQDGMPVRFVGKGENTFLDQWNVDRLATGRYNDQVDANILAQQKANRDSAEIRLFLDDNVIDPETGDTVRDYYDDNNHRIILGGNAVGISDTTYTHEGAHASHAEQQEEAIRKILEDTDYNDEYWDNPREVYSRLMEVRKSNRLDPKKVYKKKDLETLRKSKTPNNFLDRYDDKTLLQLINDVTMNDSMDPLMDVDYTNYAKDGGKIHIKKENRGKFTASAKRAGMGVQEYARHVLANKDRYSPTLVKRANFARNASKWKHADGGDLNLSLGEGFLYDSNGIPIYSNNSSNSGHEYSLGEQTKYRPSEESKKKRGKSTPLSGDSSRLVEFLKDAVWTGAEFIPYVGGALSIADIANDIRSLRDSEPNTTGDWANLVFDVSGLVPGLGTISKGLRLAKVAKAADKLENLNETVKYTQTKNVEDIKKTLKNIKDWNNKAIDESTKAALAESAYDKYRSAVRSREAGKMNAGLIDAIDRVIDPMAFRLNNYRQVFRGMNAGNDIVDFTGTENEKAMGGSLSTHGTDFSNGLTYINTGGTHEQNPYDGVPMGTDSQGIPNLVEEGEVIFNDYVFSNRLYPTEKGLITGNLPKKYKKHTFALIAEDMGKESSERPNDPISRRSLEDSLGKLAMVQEEQRMRKGKKGTQQMMAFGGRKYAGNLNTYGNYTPVDDSFYTDEYNRFWNYIKRNPQSDLAKSLLKDINTKKYGDIGGNTFTMDDIIRLGHDYKRGPVHEALMSAMKDYNPSDYSTFGLESPEAIYDPAWIPDPSVKGTFNTANGKRTVTGYAVPAGTIAGADRSSGISGQEPGSKDTADQFDLSFLQYAPIIGSSIGAIASMLQKPDYSNSDMLLRTASSLSRPRVRARALNNYLTYRPLDRNYYLNQLKAQAGATRRGIANMTGNAGAAMAGLLAADYNAQNAVGNTLMQMEQYNDAQRQRVAEFNRGTDMFNKQAFMQADQLNAQIAQQRDRMRIPLIAQAAQMREDTDTALAESRSSALTDFFDNLGYIGQDVRNRNMANSASGRYKTKGSTGRAYYSAKNGGMLTKGRRRK